MPAARRFAATVYMCEYICRPATGSSALRIVPVSDSVMNRVRPLGPPNATLVVDSPSQERMR